MIAPSLSPFPPSLSLDYISMEYFSVNYYSSERFFIFYDDYAVMDSRVKCIIIVLFWKLMKWIRKSFATLRAKQCKSYFFTISI